MPPSPLLDDKRSERKRSYYRADELRRTGVGLTPQYRSMATIRPRGRLRCSSYMGELCDERPVALRASLGTLPVLEGSRVPARDGIPDHERKRRVLAQLAYV